jgi:hypothetical protein
MKKHAMVSLGATIGVMILSLLLFAGGKPSKGTAADKRLKGNQSMPPKSPPKPVKKPPVRGG